MQLSILVPRGPGAAVNTVVPRGPGAAAPVVPTGPGAAVLSLEGQQY